MATNKESKENLHKKNKHQNGYNFEELCKIYPALTEFVFINKFNT